MLRQPSIAHLVNLVQYEIQQVESGDKRGREIDIGRYGEFGIISRVDGVGSCQDGCSSVEGGDDTCFGDGHRLLFLPSQPQILVLPSVGGDD